MQDSQLNKYAKRKQETVIFSLVHPGKPGVYERACITCGTAPDRAAQRARRALGTSPWLKDSANCL